MSQIKFTLSLPITFIKELEMKKLYSFVAWVFVALVTPTIALAANHIEHKNINYQDVFTSHPSSIPLDSRDGAFDDKAIIRNAAPSHGSFQDVSERQSTWWTQPSHVEGNNDFFGTHHESNRWSSWLADEQHHGNEHGFGEHQWEGRGDWEQGGEHSGYGNHDWCVGDPVTQPVPEPGTYMLMLLGLVSLALLKRRQY
jgi:PEP-CTERM motif